MEGQISPELVRGARGLLGWSQDKLAETAGVSKPTVADFERGSRDPMPQNLLAMRRAIEETHRVEFVEEDEEGWVGLRFRPATEPEA